MLPRKIRGDGGSDAPDPECVRCFQGRDSGEVRAEGRGRGGSCLSTVSQGASSAVG